MGRKKIGRYPKAFRQMAIERMKESVNITALSKELGIDRRLLYTWREQLDPIDHGDGPPENSKERELQKEIKHLKSLLGDKTLELDFFKGALQKVEARRRSNKDTGGKASTTIFEK